MRISEQPSTPWHASWRRRPPADWPGPRPPFAAAGNAPSPSNSMSSAMPSVSWENPPITPRAWPHSLRNERRASRGAERGYRTLSPGDPQPRDQGSVPVNLQSYVCGSWYSGRDGGVATRDATTGEIIAHASSTGIDFAAVLRHAREVGGPALRSMTFHVRAALLKALAKRLSELKEEFYALSYRTGATKSDSLIDIDGGIGTVFVFASKGSRELPNAHVYVDGDVEGLSKTGGFLGQHLFVSREGAAVHINAFNFPVWGMLEKLAPTLLAGMPAIVKPATATAYLTELVVRRIIESKILPEGALQLVCGGLGNLFEGLDCQDTVAFTGSASTAQKLRVHPVIVRRAVRFVAETDSLNSSILAPD